MREIELTVKVNHTEAKQNLADIEHGIQRIEGTSTKATPAVSKVTQALQQQAAGANQMTASAKAYESAVIRTMQTVGLMNAQQAAMTRELAKGAAAAGISATAVAGLAGAAVLAAAAVGGLLRFLYDSAEAYVKQSGILDYHQKAIAGVKDAWHDLFVEVGAALVGSGADFTGWLGAIESGLRRLSARIREEIEDFRALAAFMRNPANGIAGFFGLSFTPGSSPTPQNATRDADGNPTAYGRMSSFWDRVGSRATSINRPYGGDAMAALRAFDQAEAERDRKRKQAADELNRLLEKQARLIAEDIVDAYEDTRKAGQRYYDLIRDANEGYTAGLDGLRFRQTFEADYLNSSINQWLKLRETIQLTNVAVVTGVDNLNLPGEVNIGKNAEALRVSRPPTAFEKGWGVLMGGIDRAGDALSHLADVTRNGAVRGVSMLVDTFNAATKAGQEMAAGIKAGIVGIMQVVSGAISGIATMISATGSGSTGARIAGGAIAGFGTGAMIGSVIPGIGTVVGGVVGAAAGAFIGWYRGSRQGRSMVKDFAQEHGGFDALHRELNALGDEGERLWVRLTQGVGRGNPQEAQAAINAVTLALEQQKYAAEQAGQAQVDAQQKVVDEIKGRLDALNGEYDRLWQSIKDEAPEEVMGVIERETRERMAAIAEERQHVQEELDAANQALQESMDKVAEALDRVASQLDRLTRREWRIPVSFDAPGMPGGESPEAHTGGYLYGGKVYPFPVMHGGGSVDEFPIIAQSGEYMMSRQAVQRYGRGFMDSINRGTGRGQKVVLQTIVQLERRVLAEAMAEEYVA